MSELFEAHTKRKVNPALWIIGGAALIGVLLIGFAAIRLTRPSAPTMDEILAREIRDNTILLLDYPTYSGDEFREQILGRGRLLRYVKVNDEAFFSYPESDEQEFNAFVAKYFYDAGKLEFGREEDGVLRVGDYKIPVSSYASRFFRTKLANIKIDATQTLNFPYADVNYTMSLAEMNAYMNGSWLYGGKLIAREAERTNKPITVFVNHGIMISKPEEPSLKRFAESLIRDIADNREARVQRLVDFVSSEIAYNFVEGYGTRETLKRANETLMTRNGDCSNKTILLASLFEQIGEEYILLYCPQHITVAVPQGGFSNDNRLDFTWNERNWVIAETTLSGFQIGKTEVQDKARLQTVRYVQEPRHMQVIIDADSYESLNLF